MPSPEQRNPDTFVHSRLAIADFDGTIAQTFEPSPAGVGVHEAHDEAVEFVFGTDGLKRYQDSGGLQNRAPHELAQSLAPEASEDEIKDFAGQLVKVKLDILLGEIGTHFAGG